jgi:hypothetical protein
MGQSPRPRNPQKTQSDGHQNCPEVEQLVVNRWAAEERGFVKTITEVGCAQLGDVEFDALFASGQRMNREQAIILCKQPG